MGWHKPQTQTALSEHYREGNVVRAFQKEKKEGKKIDIKAQIFQRAKKLERCIKEKNVNNLDIKYNLKCIEEGIKNLSTIECMHKKWSKVKRLVKPSWKGASKVADSLNIPVVPPIPFFNVKSLLEAPIVCGKEVVALARGPYFRPKRSWYQQYVKKEGEGDQITDWHWHYAIIGHIKDEIKYGKDEALKEQATEALISYVRRDPKVWQKTPEEVQNQTLPGVLGTGTSWKGSSWRKS